ncbi:MAG: hypothetical protein R2770_04820 [Acidimicrobiales bacterium]
MHPSRLICVPRFRALFAAFVALAVGTVLLTPVAAGAVVAEEPRLDVPIPRDGEVWDAEQVGPYMVVAGNFTQVEIYRNGPIVNQPGIYAYEIDSGRFLDTFRPTLSAANKAVEVRDLEAAPDGRSVYLGGRFTAIDDHTDGRTRTRNRLALLSVPDGRLDRNFAQAGVDSKVLTIAVSGGYLYAGGIFQQVYDTAPGRPPIVQPVRGLARFDATSGAFDTGFRFETNEDAGSINGAIRNFGVSRLDVSPDGSRLVVAHRGMQIFNRSNNTAYRRPGVAIIALGGTPSVTAFQALYPDPNDPVQDFYWGGQCSGRGIQIKDLEVSPDGSFFVTTHQGADGGYQCDTATRWPMSDNPSRPDWVARAFDSVFSVGIDDDAIYIGGHFRYMVSPAAPSSYPGRTAANGQRVGDMYTASPTSSPFRNDLINPGYVYPADQIGALDPVTGKGIPAFNPGSDAFKGILAITVVDRGVVIGQDRNYVSGERTGRSAFFDENPLAGDPRCSVTLGADRSPVISFTDIGGVNTYSLARNGAWLSNVAGTTYTDTNAPLDTDLTYELRFNRNGLSQTAPCGTVRVPSVALVCTATPLAPTTVEISWNDAEGSRYVVRRDGLWIADVDGLSYTDFAAEPGVVNNYRIDVIRNGQLIRSGTCSTTPAAPPATCSVSVVGNEVTVSFNGDAFSRVSVRRDGVWQATVEGVDTYSHTVEPGTYSYSVRGTVNGVDVESDCGSVTIDPADAACVIAVVGDDVVMSWQDVGAQSYQARTDGSWAATLGAGVTSWTDTGANGQGKVYELRYRLNGITSTIPCN